MITYTIPDTIADTIYRTIEDILYPRYKDIPKRNPISQEYIPISPRYRLYVRDVGGPGEPLVLGQRRVDVPHPFESESGIIQQMLAGLAAGALSAMKQVADHDRVPSARRVYKNKPDSLPPPEQMLAGLAAGAPSAMKQVADHDRVPSARRVYKNKPDNLPPPGQMPDTRSIPELTTAPSESLVEKVYNKVFDEPDNLPPPGQMPRIRSIPELATAPSESLLEKVYNRVFGEPDNLPPPGQMPRIRSIPELATAPSESLLEKIHNKVFGEPDSLPPPGQMPRIRSIPELATAPSESLVEKVYNKVFGEPDSLPPPGQMPDTLSIPELTTALSESLLKKAYNRIFSELVNLSLPWQMPHILASSSKSPETGRRYERAPEGTLRRGVASDKETPRAAPTLSREQQRGQIWTELPKSRKLADIRRALAGDEDIFPRKAMNYLRDIRREPEESRYALFHDFMKRFVERK